MLPETVDREPIGQPERNAEVARLLTTAARRLAETVDGSGCAISRVIGDVLIQIAEYAKDQDGLPQLGYGFLISEYPETKAVLEQGEPRTLSLLDTDVDPGEAALLREFGFDSLLMLPLVVDAEAWALVEVYRATQRPFSPRDVGAAAEVVTETAERLYELL